MFNAPSHPLRAFSGGACERGGMWRLRVRPSQPGLRGPRESPPGPTTWVRPQGLVERMNAGRKLLRDQGDLANGSFRFQKAVPRTKENAAVERREARRSALWTGNPVSQTGWVLPQGRPTAAADSAAANFGAPLPSDGGAKGSKPTIWTEARRDAPRGNNGARTHEWRRNDDVEICAHTSLRHARPCCTALRHT